MTIPTTRCTYLLTLALFAPTFSTLVAASEPDSERGRLLGYRGEARAPDTGALLYVEEHLFREQAGSPTQRLVLYRCTDGTPFARKHIDYGAEPFAPTFELVDARLDYREGLRREDTQWIVFGGVGGRAHQTPLSNIDSVVADAGFDAFIRRHWAQLQSGQSVSIDFLVPSRARTYGFSLNKVGALEIDGAAASRLRLSLGGVLGLFAPPIDVIYRDADQWLLRFEGMTNIRESARKNLVAHIAFPEAPQPVDAAQWAQASTAELQGCALTTSG